MNVLMSLRRTFALCLFVWHFGVFAWAAPSAPGITAVDSVGMTVQEMDRSMKFYTEVLTFEPVSDVEVWGSEYEQFQGIFGLRMRVVRLKLGEECIELTEYLTPKGKPIPPDSRSHDHWFQHVAIIVQDMNQAYHWLRQHQIRHVSTGPQRLPDWNPQAGGIRAFYFQDPDGHVLEILQFPPGKGQSKWHQPTDRLFLGIDHTAIVVKETEASLRMFRDTLGLRVVGESENYGTEQEHLNQVFGARLRITALRAIEGPGIEFLEYLSPNDGRSMPESERPNDLFHWHTRLVTTQMPALIRQLTMMRTPFLSGGPITLPSPTFGFASGLLIRDPTGHVLQIVQR
ncbi:VOC family protein [Candidatus Nitrospira neomarina]|uniref:VOC family protein n=1 Tax=Candidatus Nitrospira neomarina TaxID=3020899 RepID=A0AA96K2H5_9BACT|nr:VOC family protein [Candidatus Nitrospira neomarina]WNM64141.1 VOC family protein [Candidatus Nitrospira neomarina]